MHMMDEAQQALRAAELEKTVLLDTLPEVFCYLGTDLRVRWINRAGALLAGRNAEELAGHRCHEVWHGLQEPCADCPAVGAKASGCTQQREIVREDGRRYEVRVHPVLDEHGRVAGLLECGRDITEQRKAEEEILKFRTVLDRANYGAAICDLDGGLLYVNDALAAMHGYTIDELRGATVRIFHSAEQLPRVRELVDSLRREGGFSGQEVGHMRRGGDTFPALMSAVAILDGQGRQLYYSVTVTDITDYRRAQDRLWRSEARFRQFFELGTDGRSIETGAGDWLNLNDRFCELLGYGREELLWRRWQDLLHPDDVARDQEAIGQLARGESDTYALETRFVRKDGGIVHALISVTCTRGPGGRIDQIYRSVVDIGDRVKAEQALRESEATARVLLDNPIDEALLINPAGRILGLNQTLARRIGRSQEEIVGTELSDHFPAFMTQQWQQTLERLLITKSPMRHEEVFGRQTYDTVLTPILDTAGNVQKVAIITREITERKEAERRLLEYQQRLRDLSSELGRAEDRTRRKLAEELHAGVSQLLYGIRTRLELLAPRLADEDLRRALEEVVALVARANQDIRRMTFDLHPPVLQESGLESALAWLAGEFSSQYGISCAVDSAPTSLPLSEEAGTILYRAVRELLNNVLKHAQAGSVRIALSQVDDRGTILVQDDGVGMEVPDDRDDTVGMRGFGLFNIRERLSSIGGHMRIESALGHGTRVTLAVPLMPPRSGEPR
jgi:two-component system, NarL family, sensor histidine kinase UhpB